jgi:hypothetical protein
VPCDSVSRWPPAVCVPADQAHTDVLNWARHDDPGLLRRVIQELAGLTFLMTSLTVMRIIINYVVGTRQLSEAAQQCKRTVIDRQLLSR